MGRRTQIDLGNVTFENALVDDQMLQCVDLFLPILFRQLDRDAVIENQIPAPPRHQLEIGDAGGNGAVILHRIHQFGGR